MIEQALYEHLKSQAVLMPYLATYNNALAIFNQEAPTDMDKLWNDGPQYGRVVFAVDLEGDPARIVGGTLAVDIMCKEDGTPPEEIEPKIRALIHGYFFSNGTFAVSAQWRNSSYFTQPPDKVIGCTLTFDLLGFPKLTTSNPDVIERVNKWTSETFPNVHVINYDTLPSTAWKPSDGDSAVYWRLVTDTPAGWIPDTFQTSWRIAHCKCHVFSADNSVALEVSRNITTYMQAVKRILKDGEAPLMVNRRNNVDMAADPLRTGQVTAEITYGVIVRYGEGNTIQHIGYAEGNVQSEVKPDVPPDGDGFILSEDGVLICTGSTPPTLSDDGTLI